MARAQRIWMYSPKRPTRPPVPDYTRVEVEQKANALVEATIKPQNIKPPPAEPRFNYLVDVTTKWRGAYFYFIARYACPGPNALSPFFDTGFARMEYAGANRFNLAYMRHTGKWWEIYQDLSLDECLETIAEQPHFLP